MTINVQRLRRTGTTVRLDLARFFPSLILLGYGLFILSLYVRGIMTLYINPSYVWPTTAAGLLLLVLAAVRLPQGNGSTCTDDACCGSGACGCEEPSTRLWPYFVLCLPLALAVLVPPQSLGSFSARQRGAQIAGAGTVAGAGAINRVSLSVDTRSFGFQDWIGALASDPNPRDYLGKPVRLTGMVLRNPASVPHGYIMVMRYQVTCCIADARAEGLVVRDTSHGALQDNQWVTLTGSMGALKYQGQSMAVVNPKRMVQTKAGNPYMY